MIKFKTLRHALMMTAATLGGTMAATVADRPAYAQEVVGTYAIPAQDLDGALRAFAMQTGRDVLYPPQVVAGKRSPGARGQMTERQALGALLAGSGLTFSQTSSGGYALQDPNAPVRLSDGNGMASDASLLPDILVQGLGSLNGDIRRTEDDAQPYVVLSGEEILRSGATNLEDFLRTRLPMNSQRAGDAQLDLQSGNQGGITLRGLSAAQTLILVDGRRVPGVGIGAGAGVGQPNINGIPPSAIERIEILPATAGGIYGGGATGGVINIVLKRDYSGLDLDATYGDAFDGDVAYTSLNLSGGRAFNQGRTRVTFNASQSSQNQLLSSDRDFLRRGRELNFNNRPADFTSPVSGSTPNLCSTATATSSACSGATLVLDPAYGGASLGSSLLGIPDGYGGTPDGVAALVAAAGRYNFSAGPNAGSLYSAPSVRAASFAVHHEFSDNLKGFLDLGYSQTEASSTNANSYNITLAADDPNNPFQQNIRVNIPLPDSPRTNRRELENESIRGGLIADLPGDWTGSLEHAWSRSVASTQLSGLLPSPAAATPYLRTVALRDPNVFPVDPTLFSNTQTTKSGPFETELNDTILRFSGPVLRLPAGPIRVSGYLERRKETLAPAFFELIAPPSPASFTLYHPKSQEVRSAYLETRVPVFTPDHSLPFVQELELFAAVRRDEYESRAEQGTGVGGTSAVPSRDGPFPASPGTSVNEVSSTDYTLGLRYAPVRDLTFRASFGTGFLPPNLGQISSTSTVVDFSFLTDPRRGGGSLPSQITYVSGGDLNLSPERSESLSAGMVITPRFMNGLRVSIDYSRISKTDEISTLSLQNTLLREADFPGLIIRGPNLPGDQPGWAGPITQLNNTAFNVAETLVEAYDFQVDYDIVTERFGAWRPYLIATLQTTVIRRLLPTDPEINVVGFSVENSVFGAEPLEWRGNFGVNWDAGPWNAGWDAQFYDSRNVCVPAAAAAVCAAAVQRQGSTSIPEQLYHDVYVSYSFDETGRWPGLLSGTELRLGIQNLLDEDPPIVASTSPLARGMGYDYFGDPRLRRFTLTLRKHF